MPTDPSRRRFLGTGLALGAGLLVARPVVAQAPDRGPRLDLDRIRELVRVAHFDPDAVVGLLDAEPALANACHDWGGGDFETPLGAASHMGRRDIALLLLARGARIDIFCAAMLGETASVAALLAFDPTLVHTKGPHGLSLLHHAEQGGHAETMTLVRAAAG